MSPLLTDGRRTALYVLAWVLLGLAVALLARVWGGPAWAAALAFTLPMVGLLGLMTTSAYFVCRAEPLTQGRGWRSGLRYGLAALTSGGLWTGVCVAWQQALGATELPDAAIVVLWVAGSVSYLLVLLGHDVWSAVTTLRAAQDSMAQAQLELRDAQLQALRMQIQPHFLFNSLNSISALTSIDPAAARDMTLELAQFFRATLELSEKELLPLREELELCQRFLAIEKIRYGERLQVELDVSAGAAQVMLAPMLIQPLVENAIKHGIRHLPQGGLLQVQALTRDGWLYVRVRNPVASVSGPHAGATGTGLRNIAARLRSRYGDRSRLSAQQIGEVYVVELVLPIQEKP